MGRGMARAAAAATAIVLLAPGSTLASATAQAASQPLTAPGVINGTPGSALSSAAVALDLAGWECTGSLWRPRIIITAAHCIADSEGVEPPVNAADIRVYAPGSDKGTGPTPIRVTQVIYDANWAADSPDGEDAERDVAYLILDAPLGTPTWTRMATASEVMDLARSGAEVEYVGYGLTGPRNDPNATGSPVPLSLKTRLVPGYWGGVGEFTTSGDGVHGTCAGDSGGPFLATIAGQLVYIGPLNGGSGHPCEAENDTPEDVGAVASAMAELAQQALTAAGETAEAVPTTCIQGRDVERTCLQGKAWSYDYCWSGAKATLQRRTASGWKSVSRVRGKRTGDCDRDTPFEISFSGIATEPKTSFRVVLPKQVGLRSGAVDPFTVTSS